MDTLPLRLQPGADLRRSLEGLLEHHRCRAAFVATGIGSLRQVRLRLAGRSEQEAMDGDFEILTLAGSISADGAHLHMSVSDANGRVTGGHAGHGCIVRTTAEVLVLLLPEWALSREPDPATGFDELVVRKEAEGDRS